jgi:hypothetical protein
VLRHAITSIDPEPLSFLIAYDRGHLREFTRDDIILYTLMSHLAEAELSQLIIVQPNDGADIDTLVVRVLLNGFGDKHADRLEPLDHAQAHRGAFAPGAKKAKSMLWCVT